MANAKWDFKDISLGLQKLRNFLLGRKHTLHVRYPPLMSPRTIPVPDIPRGPDNKYADKYYYARSAKDSVKPPVVAPIALGPAIGGDPNKKSVPGGMKPDEICFYCAPTPGATWWWDGHSYYEATPETPTSPAKDPCAPANECSKP